MFILPNLNLFFYPILEYYNSVDMGKHLDCKSYVIEKLKLTEDQITSELLNGSSRLNTRISWVINYLVKASLLERPKRGYVKITDEGKKVLLETAESGIDRKYLKLKYPEFANYINSKPTVTTEQDEELEEEINTKYEYNVEEYYTEVEEEILERLFKEVEDKNTIEKGDLLENITKKLFEKMGYYKVIITGQSGDGGIDGYFAIDKFGLQKIGFQCKCYNRATSVGSKDIDAFAGSLVKMGFKEGVFITTSRFTKQSEYKNITLIDGRKLVELMREHEIRCRIIKSNYQYDLL